MDKLFLMDILEMEKNMAVNMTYALNEASNDILYQELYDIFQSISEMTKEIFNLAYNKNYYRLTKVDNSKINETINNLKEKLN